MVDDVKTIIEQVVRERLGDTNIIGVEIEEDNDSEVGSVYRVTVIYSHADGLVDAHKAAGLARHTRSRLSERNVFRFPIFSFVSQSDAKKLRSAAA
jgi:hypothetical protein